MNYLYQALLFWHLLKKAQVDLLYVFLFATVGLLTVYTIDFVVKKIKRGKE